MDDSPPNPNIFSLRIVSIDYYMSPPIPDTDICYSSFQGGKINEVPVIRVYGATPAGQKTCLHIHRAFPYFYVPCSDIVQKPHQQGENYMNELCLELEKALKHKRSASSKRQHVHGCSLVRARKFYGYHSSEELFIKIYLYYPHDVSRASGLLLGGAVLGKSMQPHESHIPFILQFLVDYNLYGMGHVHLSKIKFRLPVPDVFTSREFNCKSQLGLEMDNSADLSSNFQADLSGRELWQSPIWTSSTIPNGWMWQIFGQLGSTLEQDFSNVRRHSVCELEGDAVVDEILNQQFKTFVALSQTNSDAKMVQSLIPIWEEEYERTGIHEIAVTPDPGKPFPEDVLKILSHDLEFERKFTELCGKLEGSVPLLNGNQHDDNLNHAVMACYENLNEESSNCVVGKDGGVSLSPQSSFPEKEICAASKEGKDACSESVSDGEIQPSKMIASLDSKASDTEALGLLRWLATSQAAEDINSDDELVRETILSPLLPATSIDQVLEKANLDYESESQKECQDILDSIADLIPTEELKEAYGADQKHSPQTSSKKKISQVDVLPASPEKVSENKKKHKAKNSEHHVLHSAGKNLSDYCKQKNSLWGSLPFSMMQENHQPETGMSKIHNDKCGNSGKNHVAIAVTEYEGQKSSDAFTRNMYKDDCEKSAEIEWSVRDLMRRKRRQQFTQQDGGYVQIKKSHSREDKGENSILLPNQLDQHMIQNDDYDKKTDTSLNSGPSAFNQQTAYLDFHNSMPMSSGCSMPMTMPFNSSSDSPLQGSAHNLVETGTKALQPCNISKKQESTVADPLVHWGACKDFSSVSVASVEAKISNVGQFKSHPLSDNCWSNDAALSDKNLGQTEIASSSCIPSSHVENELISAKNEELRYGHSSVISTKNIEALEQNIVGIDVSVSATLSQHKQYSAEKKRADINASVVGGLASIVVNNEEKPVELIGLTFYKNPPVPEWNDGTSDGSSALSSYTSLLREDKDGMSGIALDELKSFFEEDFHEKKISEEPQSNNSYHIHHEAIMGVSTHYQNDGSALYILAPCFAPPSAGSVSRWLLNCNGDAYRELNAQSEGALLMEGSCEIDSQGTLPGSDKKDLATPGPVSCLMSSLGQGEKKICQKPRMASPSAGNKMQIDNTNEKMESHADLTVDTSQISGPDGKSMPTPLSQIGFRDPASVGAGQQLTLLSIEVQAECRGDLRPDPRFDAINVLALAFQNDGDSAINVCVLLRVNNTESVQRSSDGLSGCKVLVFSEEKDLFGHFVQIIRSADPDILLGWDIQGGSLGFLAERAAYLGIGLLNKVSRTPMQTSVDKREFSDKEILDSISQEPLIADAALVEDAIIEDEWGRTHASGVHVGGRIVLNVWRLMRGEVKLNMYTVEAVSEAVLRQKIPSIPYRVLNNWFLSGPGRARHRCMNYVTQRAKLNLDIVNQLDMINRTSELARIFGIDFFSVLSRGSQYRVESMFLRLAHTQNYLAVSPGNMQVASQPAMECLPLVMEPESGFYADPVVVLDFQSLYPSMIIAYNLCFCTCLGNVAPSKVNTLGVSSFSPDPHLLQCLKDKMLLTPNGVMYAPSEVRKGILPRLLEEILSTRIMVKQAMKKLAPSQQVLQRIFNARQLALKLIANVTYGYTAAGFSGRMPCAELADSIVQCGRSTLEKAISLVNANDKWKAKVIYGDTDSMFVLLKGRTVKDAFQIGREIASAVTAINPNPVTLKLEKVYHPCFLLTKKRYVGYSYESADQIDPIFDAKGIETVRRDTCGAVAKMMEQSLRLFFKHQNIAMVKAYLQRQWTRILSGRVSLQDFVFAKEVRLGTYSTRSSSSLPPAAIVATKAMRTDPRAEPRYAERVPYVVIHGEPGARLVDMVVDPLELLAIDSPYRLNDVYYINKQIIPALQRVFGLVGVDLNQWFLDMPRPVREAFSKRTSYALNPQRTRIDFYYLSKHCVLCGELVHGSAHLCNECLHNETAVATAVVGRTSKLEMEMQHLVAICRHCGGGDWIVDRGVKCTSLACSLFYERRKIQKELQGLSAVGTDKGFYPKCMAEWF